MKILLSFIHGTPVSVIIIVGICLIACWMAIFGKWERGFCWLLYTTPFTGATSLWMYPLEWPKLLKDFLFVIPCYLSFLYATKGRKEHSLIPKPVIWGIGLLACIVVIQCFNPNLENWVMAAIGVKVWLFYIPLLFVAYHFLNEKKDLIDLFRILMVLACVPVLVGYIQFLSDHIVGHVKTIQFFYGAAGYAASHNYGGFYLGGAYLYRVPSTFTFQSQFLYYLLITLTIAYAARHLEPNVGWRRFASTLFWLITLATYLSGARAGFVLTPFLTGFMILWAEGLKPAFKSVGVSLVILLLSLKIPGLINGIHQTLRPGNVPGSELGQNPLSGPSIPFNAKTEMAQIPILKAIIKPVVKPVVKPIAAPAPSVAPPKHPPASIAVQPAKIFRTETGDETTKPFQGVSMLQWGVMMSQIILNDPKGIGYDLIKSAIERAPWGMGTGMNTGAARLTYSDPKKFVRYENYYAKTIFELGVPGFLILLFLYGSIVFYGKRIIRSLEHKDLRILAIGIISLMLVCFLLSLKAWMLDQDPMNFFFWVFAGFLFKLPAIDRALSE